jgi:hypothetical protein
MKKKMTLFLLVFLVFLASIPTYSQDESQTPQYMVIVADIEHPEVLGSSKIYISVDGEKYIEKKFNNPDTEGKFDFNPLIRIIKDYNKRGWKIMASNMSSGYNQTAEKEFLFIMMQRDEPYQIENVPRDTIFKN